MVETVQEARNAVLFSSTRSAISNPECQAVGSSQLRPKPCCLHLGRDYPTNANNNIFIMIQIESPAGVGIINTSSKRSRHDAVMVASNDFGQQVGDRDGSRPTRRAKKSSASPF